MLRESGDELLAARAADLEDVAARIVGHLAGVRTGAPEITVPSIVAAADLPPSITASIPQEMLLGIALSEGSKTAHAAILARAYGIPAVVGVGGLLEILDGGAGFAGPLRRRHRRGRPRPGQRHRRAVRRRPGRGGGRGSAGARGGGAPVRDARRPGGHPRRQRRRCRRGAPRGRPRGQGGRPLPDRVPVRRARHAADGGRADRRLPGGRRRLRAPPGHDPPPRRGRRQADPVPPDRARGEPVPGRSRAPSRLDATRALPDPAPCLPAGGCRERRPGPCR